MGLTLEGALRARLEHLIGDAIRACETAIRRELAAAAVPLIREMGEYVALAGGKRLRPILVLLAARLGDRPIGRAVGLGTVVELLHTATLIHDDVVDQAPLRRGRPSANARWGNDASVLVGDHLYSRCMALLVADGDLQVMDALAAAMVSMTEAEVFQLERKRAAGHLTEADYLRIIRQKTATFMCACSRIGGLAGGLDGAAVDALAGYGERLGIAFQIIDDSLDFEADELRLGKAIGSDLREGKQTLPLIVTLERATAEERAHILAALGRPGATASDLAEVRRLVKVYDGVGYAVGRAAGYAAEGAARLAGLPAGEAREILTLIADYVVQRDR